jgi:hypothetical protein
MPEREPHVPPKLLFYLLDRMERNASAVGLASPPTSCWWQLVTFGGLLIVIADRDSRPRRARPARLPRCRPGPDRLTRECRIW